MLPSPVGRGVQGGDRPVIVISNDVGNVYSPVVIVVPTTTKIKKNLPTHFKIDFGKPSTVLCEQVFTIPKASLGEKIYTLTYEELEELDKALAQSLGIRRK